MSFSPFNSGRDSRYFATNYFVLTLCLRYTSAKGIKIPLKMKFKAKQLESAKNLIRLQSSVNARWFKKGDVVYREGEIGDSIFFVDDNIGGEHF